MTEPGWYDLGLDTSPPVLAQPDTGTTGEARPIASWADKAAVIWVTRSRGRRW